MRNAMVAALPAELVAGLPAVLPLELLPLELLQAATSKRPAAPAVSRAGRPRDLRLIRGLLSGLCHLARWRPMPDESLSQTRPVACPRTAPGGDARPHGRAGDPPRVSRVPA